MIANAKKRLEQLVKNEAKATQEGIYEKTARMEKHFAINIDIKKVSIKQFQAYETLIINEHKERQHGRR